MKGPRAQPPAPPKPENECLPPRGGSLEPCEKDDKVEEASDESFPASDPPAWSPIKSP